MRGRPRAFTNAQYHDCIRRYADGHSLEGAAAVIGMASATLRRWMVDNNVPRRSQGARNWPPREASRVKAKEPRVKEAGMIDLRDLSGGDCVRINGLCEFKRCRHNCAGGGCAIKIAGNGAQKIEDICDLVGLTRQGVQNVLRRTEIKVRKAMIGWAA